MMVIRVAAEVKLHREVNNALAIDIAAIGDVIERASITSMMTTGTVTCKYKGLQTV